MNSKNDFVVRTTNYLCNHMRVVDYIEGLNQLRGFLIVSFIDYN